MDDRTPQRGELPEFLIVCNEASHTSDDGSGEYIVDRLTKIMTENGLGVWRSLGGVLEEPIRGEGSLRAMAGDEYIPRSRLDRDGATAERVDRFKFEWRCARCGLSTTPREEVGARLLDRLQHAGLKKASLRALAGRISHDG